MRIALIAILLAGALSGQVLLDPNRIPPGLRNFDKVPAERTLDCRPTPLRPVLNFSFRFQAGYLVRVPMRQYLGPGHRWVSIMRITPDSGGEPVYMGSNYNLPDIPKTNVELEVGEGFLLGQGKYHVVWQLFDDIGRSCRAAWTMEAKLSRSERNVPLAIAPNTVRPFSYFAHAADASQKPKVQFPVTILLNAAPISPRRISLSGRDRLMLLGLLSALLERLPTASMRVVVFSLDQQTELYRAEHFSSRNLEEVAHALNHLELGKVDVKVLENRHGSVDLLSGLVNRELTGADPSRAVLFVGPLSRHLSKAPAEALATLPEGGPHFFYLEYEPGFGVRIASNGTVLYRQQAALPDAIAGTVRELRGKTLAIRTPADFAKAMGLIGHSTSPRPEDERQHR